MVDKENKRDLAYMVQLDTGIVEKPSGAPDSDYRLIKETLITLGPLVSPDVPELIIMSAIVKLIERFGSSDDVKVNKRIISNIQKFVSTLEPATVCDEAQEDNQIVKEIDVEITAVDPSNA